jgi:RNA polymerase-binding transcription factor DksA
MTPASKSAQVKGASASRAAAAKASSRAGGRAGKKAGGRPAAATGKKRAGAKVVATAAKRSVLTKKKKALPVVKKSAPSAKKAAPAKKAPATAKKAAPPPKKATVPKKAPATAKKAPATAKKAAGLKKSGPATAKKAPAKSAAKRGTEARAAGNGAPSTRTPFTPKSRPAPVRPKTGPYAKDQKFLDEVRDLLMDERAVYQEQATSLRAEADSLALEREPGDVQFDEESGEGGTVTVDRERNLALSGQATLAVEEIDDALRRIADKTYGYCERCFQPIPKPRLRALPYARLCVACKSGGLSRR